MKMRRQLGIFASVAVAAALALLVPLLWGATVSFLWDYDFSRDRACSSAVTAACISHFRVREGSTVLSTVAVSELRTASGVPIAGSTVAVSDVSYGLEIPPPYGQRTLCVTAVTNDGIESAPACAVANIRPGPPINVRMP